MNDRKERKYYDLLISNGDNITILFILISIIEFFVAFGSFAELHIGMCILWIISGITTIMFGFWISRFCICIAEIAKNSEKQTELLEKLNENINNK